MRRPSTPSLRNDRVILKVSDPILILEGRRAASWLAMQDYDIGLHSPACYPQGEAGEIVKVNLEICLARGVKITKKIEDRWRESTPDDLVLHRPPAAVRPRLDALFTGGA